MARLNPSTHELDVKIVYYGPALSGKTTNLTSLHRLLGDGQTSKLLSVNTQEDRTLFFDLLPVDLGETRGFSVRFRLYTVPGQVHYAATRRVVLAGADAVVAVLDSDPSRGADNLASVADLLESMRENGLDPNDVPVLVQWNKRDLPGVRPVAELQWGLSPWRPPCVEAVATEDRGVRETFGTVMELALRRLASHLELPELGSIALALRCRVDRASPATAPRAARVVRPGGSTAPEGAPDGLLRDAVSGMVSSAEDATARDRERQAATRERDDLRQLAEVSRRLLAADDTKALSFALERAMAIAGADAGAITIAGADGGLKERVLEGLSRDPLARMLRGGRPVLASVLATHEALHAESLEHEVSFAPVSDGVKLLASGAIVRLGTHGRTLGALTLYSSRLHAPVRRGALEILVLLAGHVSLFLEQLILRTQVSASRQAWVSTVDALHELLYVVDEGLVLQRVNQAFAQAVGADPRSLVGRRCHEVLFGREAPCATCFLGPILQGRSSDAVTLELQGYLPGRTLEARGVALSRGATGGRMALATLQDVTARKAMARELVESEKLASLGRLSAGLAHEINNPLSFIRGNLDYVGQILGRARLAPAPEEEARAALRDAGAGVDRVGRVVAQLRRYAPDDESDRAPMDLWQVVRCSAHIARDECSRAGVTLKLHGERSLPMLGHPGKLGTVVRALVKNAIEASPERGVVDVTALADGDRARIDVRDGGPGIPGDARAHLFEPFFTTKGPGKHLGLSLAVAHALVTAMGGTIELGPGSGSGATFTVELPLAEAVRGAARAPAGRRRALAHA